MIVAICGGGNLGHTIAGALSQKAHTVNLLTRNPAKWNNEIIIEDCVGESFCGKINKISSRPEDIIPGSQLVVLCVPGFLLRPAIEEIKNYVSRDTVVCSVVSYSGFFWVAKSILGDHARLIGFQRVPFISRIQEYGKSAKITGRRSLLKMAFVNCPQTGPWKEFFESGFDTSVTVLSHYLEAALSNSNPLLHPSRLFGVFESWDPSLSYKNAPFFYADWDERSSEILISADNEFQNLIQCLPININETPTLLKYYECENASTLTCKIRSIKAFKNIRLPMKEIKGQLVPDFTCRYFMEDIPFGLIIVKSLALMLKKNTPVIDAILYWAQKNMGKRYLADGELKGEDVIETGALQFFGVSTIDHLLNLQLL